MAYGHCWLHSKNAINNCSRHIEVEYPNAWVSRHAFKTFADLVITTSDRITTGLQDALNLSRDRVMTVPTGIDTNGLNHGEK